MQETSKRYKDLLADETHWVETRLSIGEAGNLITEGWDKLVIGGIGILTGASGADAGFDESVLYSIDTEQRIFSGNVPAVGSCVAAEIEVKMLKPKGEIHRQARLTPYIRLTDGIRPSEWVQKGVFFIDTREEDTTSDALKILTIHGYDAMLKAEADYPPSKLKWPARDIDVVREIAEAMGVDVDMRTVEIMTSGYLVQLPAGYSQRETLGFLAAMYGGCFIMSDLGELRLVCLNALPPETRILVTGGADRSTITFGGVRIRV